VGSAVSGGRSSRRITKTLRIIPYAEDELAFILQIFHPLSKVEMIQKEDLYRLKFITLDSQSTIRKVIDKVLTRSDIDTKRLKVEMELNFDRGD
jgi:hypothetical protein